MPRLARNGTRYIDKVKRGFAPDADTEVPNTDVSDDPGDEDDFDPKRDRPWWSEDFTKTMGYDGNADAPGPRTSPDVPVPTFLRAGIV